MLEANRRFNLTAATSPEELTEHILDSLTVVPFLTSPYVDVGSGAGLPAIPAAIAAEMPVTLIEATAKKARFLESLLEALGIPGTVVSERAETAAHNPRWRERFASGTARAVAGASAVAELLLPFLEPGGVAVLQQGSLPEPERHALQDAALILGAEVEAERRLEGSRRIVLIRKRTVTPARFPRRSGVPAKRPLCSKDCRRPKLFAVKQFLR